MLNKIKMSNQSQHSIQVQNHSGGFQDLDFAQKRRLTIDFDQERLTLLINKSFTPPVSWFLTDSNGELATMGQIKDYRYTINLAGLPSGTYFLRIAGEVHIIEHK